MKPKTGDNKEKTPINSASTEKLGARIKKGLFSHMNKYIKNESHIKILVVDDEFEIIELIKRILKSRYGDSITVESACNGFDAGAKAEEHQPNLIIIDIRLPGIDGFEVCSSVKSRENLSNTKILAISGNSMPTFREKALKSGADDFLLKPFNKNELIEKIEKLMPKENNNHGNTEAERH
jgi:CheY-like chemotaxis protein